MNYTLDSTVGIDTVIQAVQTDLYNYLSTRWQGTLNGYGRIYKNTDADGNVLPEWYEGSNEYTEVYYNDANAGNFFFIDTDEHSTEDEQVFTTTLNCAFMVDLGEILPDETHRADSKAQRDVVEAIRTISNGRVTVTGIKTGIDNVFSGFDRSGIRFTDVHPLHSFAVVLKVSYYLSNQC
jgi:hypothetical protein